MVKSDVYSSPIVFSQLDLRVGQVLEAVPHSTSEKHYIEKVDIGKGQILEMVQEHQPYFSEEEIVGRKVVVLCNLKVIKVAKVKSQGMILAMSNGKDKYEFLEPNDDAEVGERIYASGEELVEPVTAIQMKKNKVWETLNKDIKTNNKMEVVFKDRYPVRSRTGPVHVESLKKCDLAPTKLK
ncbi:Tyrosine--trna ligase, partial [Globisporangium splendens]